MSHCVLVTGADGFVGRHLVSALKDRHYAVATHSLADGDIARSELHYSGIRHVFHLAGKSFVPDSWVEPRSFYETNVLGTANVLEFCRRQTASITFISSYVYGTPKQLPISEAHPVEALNPYAHSKVLAEQICAFYAEHFALRACIIRPFNIYGPGQGHRFLIPLLLGQALDVLRDYIEVADSRPRRDFLHVRDFVDLLIATMEHGTSGIYNAGYGVSTSIQELVAILNHFVPRPKTIVSLGQQRPQEVLDVVADIGKARRDLHWTPRVEIARGLLITLEAMSDITTR